MLILTACHKTNKDKLNKNQKEIITLYVSEYLSEDYQYLYIKSEGKRELLSSFDLPLSLEDFKLPIFSTLPGDSQQNLDTLFTEQELQNWSTQIENYHQIRWNQSLFSAKIKFIREEEFPEYLERTDIPPPGQDPVYIHYISTPFVHDDKTAILYSRKWSSGAYVYVRYHYYKKEKNVWEEVEKGRLNVGY